MELTKCASSALTASKSFYPASLSSVPAPILYNARAP